jgi:hypothetical protein
MSEETVTVALKHPHGLVLRLHEMVEVQQPVMGGGYRTVKEARPTGEKVLIKGYSVKGSKVPLPAVRGSYALTSNVPKKFWEAWKAQNRDHPYLTGGLIFAAGTENYVEGKAKERNDDIKTGLEPLDPEKLPLAGVSTYEKDAA